MDQASVSSKEQHRINWITLHQLRPIESLQRLLGEVLLNLITLYPIIVTTSARQRSESYHCFTNLQSEAPAFFLINEDNMQEVCIIIIKCGM